MFVEASASAQRLLSFNSVVKDGLTNNLFLSLHVEKKYDPV